MIELHHKEVLKLNFWKHFSTINHHKVLVAKHCFKVGLYRQGILHDMSKYSPSEFWVGVKYFQGYRSPNTAEREIKGYSSAWLHHKGRNKHHLEYWIDYSPKGNHNMVGMKMPEKYVVEMFCDRIAASKIYNKEKYKDSDPYNYYDNSKEHYMLHSESRQLLLEMLTMLKDRGEDATFKYIRENIVPKRKRT